MLFSFCYLFFLEGEILAEAQFVFSKGVTSYDIMTGAILITLVLQLVQWIVSMLSRLPSRWHAFSYLPSMLLLGCLSNLDRGGIIHFSLGNWVWIIPLVVLCYLLLVVVIRRLDNSREVYLLDIKSQIYPNFIILFLLILSLGFIPQATDVYHYELKAERLILEKDYEGAAAVGKRSLTSSARLTQLRMYALSQQGLLADRLFDYPQYDGSLGLLDVTDTLSVYRFSPQRICIHLGAYCDKSIHSTDRFYQLVLADSLWNEHTVDYYLCSLLLDKKLKEFRKELPRYYALGDNDSGVYDRLPKAYKEALLLIGEHQHALEGKIVLHGDTLAVLTDYELLVRFREYNHLKKEIGDERERVNRTHREFGNTYWWYYDYSQLANGELRKR